MVFDVDHDFEDPRAPKAHLDTVKYKPGESPGQALYTTRPTGSAGAEAELSSSLALRAAVERYPLLATRYSLPAARY